MEAYKDDYLYPHATTIMREERVDNLAHLYFLLNGIPRALDPIIGVFEEHVKAQGMWGCACVGVCMCVGVCKCVGGQGGGVHVCKG